MEAFSLRELFNALVLELGKSIGDKNIVRLWVENTVPDWYRGRKDDIIEPIKKITAFIAANLSNGIISIEIKEWSKKGDKVSCLVNLMGSGTAESGISVQHTTEEQLHRQFERMDLDHNNQVSFSAKNKKLIAKIMLELTLGEKESATTLFLNKKILIVEDNEVNALVFSSFLEDWGINVELAYNGIEGVEMAWGHEYNAIIMDIYMPGLNGIDATKRIREFNEKVPIIALSGSDLATDVTSAYEAGVSEYLIKPISNTALFNTLSKLLNLN
jgi:CheY-like chemotaxis protein